MRNTTNTLQENESFLKNESVTMQHPFPLELIQVASVFMLMNEYDT